MAALFAQLNSFYRATTSAADSDEGYTSPVFWQQV